MTFLSLHDRAWIWLGTSFYCLAFLSAVVYLSRTRRHPRSLMLSLVSVGCLFQTIGLYMRGRLIGSCPLGNDFEVIQFIVWSLIVLFLLVGPAFRMSLLGFFTSGLAATLGLISLLVPMWDAVPGPSLFEGEPGIEIHATFAMFSYGAFGTLALTSLMYLLQRFSLKRKHFRGVFRFLPSIVQLEQMNQRLLWLGVVMLTISIAVGTVYWIHSPDSVNGSKILMAGIVWIASLAVFFLRQKRVLITNALAWCCIVLFALALASLVLILKSRHSLSDPSQTAAVTLHER